MTYRSGVLTGFAASLLLLAAGGAGWWLVYGKSAGEGKPTPPPIPAVVPKPFKEEQAVNITLTAEAEERLAIRTANVERKSVDRVRVYGAEVTVPPGQAVIVSAPLAGVLKSAGPTSPLAGAAVKQGQVLFQLLPLVDPLARANLTASLVDAQGQVETAQEQLHAATIALDRAKKVLANGSGSPRLVDEAQAPLDVAKKAVETATRRRALLDQVAKQTESGTTAPLPIEVPATGILRTVSALPGQTVPSGAALFEVVDLSQVWVRVPVYVGDLAEIHRPASASIGNLSAKPGGPSRPAKPVVAPPAANPIAGTLDLFYAFDNREMQYGPGQRVAATLSLQGPAEASVVPWSAVVFDIHGGGWVYEKLADRGYARRRVVVRSVVGAEAVLASGPPPGTPVVVAGAAELFGTDVGFSK